MSALKKFVTGSNRPTAVFLAVLAFSFNNSRAQAPPSSTVQDRAAEYRAGRLAQVPTQRRTQLIGKTEIQPMIVQAPVGTTIVAGSTVINASRIVNTGPDATAAQLDVRCPPASGRTLLHGNRIINLADIEARGSNSIAAQLVKRCSSSFNEESSTDQSRFENYGRLRATQ